MPPPIANVTLNAAFSLLRVAFATARAGPERCVVEGTPTLAHDAIVSPRSVNEADGRDVKSLGSLADSSVFIYERIYFRV